MFSAFTLGLDTKFEGCHRDLAWRKSSQYSPIHEGDEGRSREEELSNSESAIFALCALWYLTGPCTDKLDGMSTVRKKRLWMSGTHGPITSLPRFDAYSDQGKNNPPPPFSNGIHTAESSPDHLVCDLIYSL